MIAVIGGLSASEIGKGIALPGWILNSFFPRRCPLCDEILSLRERGFHAKCREKLKVVGDDRRLSSAHITDGRVLYEYPCVAPGIYRFKYSGRREYGITFAEEICTELGETIKGWEADGIIAVPLHPKRYRKRGYNQSEILARELSKGIRVPFYKGVMARVKNTVPLKLLNAAQRQNNLKKAFKMCRNDVKLYRVIIIDDVYTTGQTVEEMAKVLKENGVAQIYVIALAGGTET